MAFFCGMLCMAGLAGMICLGLRLSVRNKVPGVLLVWENGGVSYASLEQARKQEAAGEYIYLYLWEQKKGVIQNPETAVEIECELRIGLGDREEALGLHFLSGGCREAADLSESCIISRSVAEQLWGSQDASGKYLVAEGRKLLVCGVTDEPQSRIYLTPDSRTEGTSSGEPETVWKQQPQTRLAVYVAPEAAAAECVRTQKELAENFLGRHGMYSDECREAADESVFCLCFVGISKERFAFLENV